MLPFPPFQPFRQVTSGLIASLPLCLSLSLYFRPRYIGDGEEVFQGIQRSHFDKACVNVPFSASEFFGDVKNRDSKTVSLTVANVDVVVAPLRLSELLWLLKRKREKTKEGRKGERIRSRSFFRIRRIVSNSRGIGDFLGWTQGQTERKKGAARGKGARIDPPASGPIKLNASLPIDKVESRQPL